MTIGYLNGKSSIRIHKELLKRRRDSTNAVEFFPYYIEFVDVLYLYNRLIEEVPSDKIDSVRGKTYQQTGGLFFLFLYIRTCETRFIYMIKKIKVKNSGVIKLQFIDDFPDGILVIGEAKKTVPFDTKRIYYITNLSNPKAIRGKHAHEKLEQYIFCVSGSFRLHLEVGKTKKYYLRYPFMALG
jgi:hypothetical protein